MKKLTRIAIVALLVLAVGYTIFSNVTKDGASAESEIFTLTSTTGEQRTLPEKGSYILNFWATYCPPCEREMPAFQAAYPKLVAQGIELYAVNVEEPTKLVNRYLTKFDVRFPVLLDREGTLKDHYEILTLPTTLFIQDGKVVHTAKGELTEAQIEELAQKIQ